MGIQRDSEGKPTVLVRILARIHDITGLNRVQFLLIHILDLFHQQQGVIQKLEARIKEGKEADFSKTLVRSANNLFFLLYHSQSPQLIRSAIRCLRFIMPLIKSNALETPFAAK